MTRRGSGVQILAGSVHDIYGPYSTTDSTPASVIAGYAYDDVIEAVVINIAGRY